MGTDWHRPSPLPGGVVAASGLRASGIGEATRCSRSYSRNSEKGGGRDRWPHPPGARPSWKPVPSSLPRNPSQ